MVKKFDVITKLYEEATQEVTESPEKWIAFLQSIVAQLSRHKFNLFIMN